VRKADGDVRMDFEYKKKSARKIKSKEILDDDDDDGLEEDLDMINDELIDYP